MADRAYRLLLALYPRSFRDRFGPEMLELFQARRRTAIIRRAWEGPAFWLSAVWDVLRGSARARWAARARFGGHRLLAGVASDARRAGRTLRRSPAFSLTVIALMGLSVGATTTVFSVVNRVLISELPYGDPARIAVVWERRVDTDRNVVAGHEFPEWIRRNHTFESMAALTYTDGVSLTDAGDPLSLFGVRVTSEFFDVMGVRPAFGRGFRSDEDTPGRGQVVVLSDRLWRERFAADPHVVNQTTLLDGRPYTIIGVMPAGFVFPIGPRGAVPDFWMPIAEPIQLYVGRHYLYVVARLKVGATMAQAQADMSAVSAAVATQFPGASQGHSASVVALHEELVREARPSLLLLLGASASLVLVGCTNIAGLLLARGLARRRQIALQLALGATHVRVARQLMFESLGLGVAGGALGFVAAVWAVRLVPSIVPSSILTLDAVSIDGRVIGFAVGVSLLTALLFGLAPVVQVRRFAVADALKRDTRTAAGSDGAHVRRTLVIGQVAVAVMLALAAGLMLRGLAALQRVDPGFRPNGLYAMELALPASQYPQAYERQRFFDDLSARLSTLPSVDSVATISGLPLGGSTGGILLQAEGRPASAPSEEGSVEFRVVSAGYFKTMGIPIAAGREFLTSDARVAVPLIRWFPQQPVPAGFDTPQAAPVAVINQSLAKRLWPNEDPVGRRFKVLFSPWITIAGVAADSRDETLSDRSRPEFYLLDAQEPQASMSVMVRSTGSAPGLAAAMRGAVWSLDRSLPIKSIKTLDAVIASAFGLPRFMSTLLGTFGLLALVLMAAGVYGLVAFTASQRLPEMGVRVALGADRGRIGWMIIREGLRLALVGVAVGGATALLAGRFMAGQFYGVSPTDPLTFATVIGVALIAVLAACWRPARFASRVDPMTVLRQD